jgi:hypothetical protein
MSRSSAPTYPPSTVRQPALRWAVLDRQERIAQTFVFALLVGWFAYTRLYFFLHPRGLTFDPSLFMYVTGRPDPLCGVTRTFAWTWRGELGQAFHVYPLGPPAFLAAAAFTIYIGLGAITGQRLIVRLPRGLRLTIVAIALVALAANWTAKLIWLGM